MACKIVSQTGPQRRYVAVWQDDDGNVYNRVLEEAESFVEAMNAARSLAQGSEVHIYTAPVYQHGVGKHTRIMTLSKE